MGFIRERPDPSITAPYPDIEPLAPHWLAASTGLATNAHWPARFGDWNGRVGDHAARILEGARAASFAASRHATPTSLLARIAVDRALAVTREEYFEPTPDREGAVELVRRTCEGEVPFDAALVQSLGGMLARPTLPTSPGSRFRSHECFVKSLPRFRACCPARDLERAIERYTATLNAAVDGAPAMCAGWAYAHCNYIHPLTNGNGRLSRVLASMVFMKRGWPPICFVKFDNMLLYSIFQQLYERGPAVRAQAFTEAFAEIHARSVQVLERAATGR